MGAATLAEQEGGGEGETDADEGEHGAADQTREQLGIALVGEEADVGGKLASLEGGRNVVKAAGEDAFEPEGKGGDTEAEDDDNGQEEVCSVVVWSAMPMSRRR